jgi:hypothetical protein
MVSPILWYLFALFEPVTTRTLFRFLTLSYREGGMANEYS